MPKRACSHSPPREAPKRMRRADCMEAARLHTAGVPPLIVHTAALLMVAAASGNLIHSQESHL